LGYVVEALDLDCQRLQPYAVLTRYPGAPFEPGEEEGRLAAEAARRVYDEVLAILGKD
jgi:HEPN domain-containing protein